MIQKNYNVFRIDLLLEAILEADPNFLNLLKDINHEYSHNLEVLFDGKEVDTTFNALQVATKNNKVKFIPDSQFSRPGTKKQKWSRTTSEADVGRLVRAILTARGMNVTDSKLEDFVNKYKAAWDYSYGKTFQFEIVKGEEIKKWYLVDNYVDVPSPTVLKNSCMRYSYCQSYFDIYSKNPDVCSMVIMKEGGKLRARALLWTLSSGSLLLDRVYSTRSSDASLIDIWLKENVKRVIIKPDTGNHFVSIKKFSFTEYPYLDTLCYLRIKIQSNGELTDAYLSDDGDILDKNLLIFALKSTEGSFDVRSQHVWSDTDKRWYFKGDVIWDAELEDWQPEDSYVQSSCSDYGWINKNNAVWSEIAACWLHKIEAVEFKDKGFVKEDWIQPKLIKVNKKLEAFEYSLMLSNAKKPEDIKEVFEFEDGFYFQQSTIRPVVSFGFEFIIDRKEAVFESYMNEWIPKCCAFAVKKVTTTDQFKPLIVKKSYPFNSYKQSLCLESLAGKVSSDSSDVSYIESLDFITNIEAENYFKSLEILKKEGFEKELELYKKFDVVLLSVDKLYKIMSKTGIYSKVDLLLKAIKEILKKVKGMSDELNDSIIEYSPEILSNFDGVSIKNLDKVRAELLLLKKLLTYFSIYNNKRHLLKYFSDYFNDIDGLYSYLDFADYSKISKLFEQKFNGYSVNDIKFNNDDCDEVLERFTNDIVKKLKS